MSDLGYIPKDLAFDDKAREKLINGITTISKAVKSTLGPRGQTVLIESENHTHGLTITKDGVTVAKAIFLSDPIENLAVMMMKQAAEKTSSTAGDGTTTAIVLTEALVQAGLKWLKPEHNTTEIIKIIKEETQNLVEYLGKLAKEVDEDKLLSVATISVNNDKELGKIIADAYTQVGKDGVVTVEKSKTEKTYAEVTNGIKIDRGYTSPLFITDQRKDECILEDVKILVCDQEINNILQIENILKPIINGGEKLLIIGECSNNVINTLSANVMRNGLKLCNIPVPSFGYRTHELMQDIALAVGAKYFSEKTGDDLSLITSADLGYANKIRVNKDSTVILRDEEISSEIIKRVEELREQQELLTTPAEKDFVNERIASLAGGIGCIYVGGNSDIEQKEKFDRVDDSVCAVRSALQEGIIPGGGLTLYDIGKKLTCDCNNKGGPSNNFEIAREILGEAIQAPLKQILINAGKDPEEIMDAIYKDLKVEEMREDEQNTKGYNVITERCEDMYEAGIIDPLKVTKQAVLNAVSVATTILTTNAIITHARK